MQTVDYQKLIKLVKLGDAKAYNDLCTEFLGYVPLVIDDLAPLLKNSHLEMEDVHQEGYLAICEAIQEIADSSKYQNSRTISKCVLKNILTRITSMLKNQRDYESHIVSSKIAEYDNFKEFMNNIRENRSLQESYITYIISVEGY